MLLVLFNIHTYVRMYTEITTLTAQHNTIKREVFFLVSLRSYYLMLLFTLITCSVNHQCDAFLRDYIFA